MKVEDDHPIDQTLTSTNMVETTNTQGTISTDVAATQTPPPKCVDQSVDCRRFMEEVLEISQCDQATYPPYIKYFNNYCKKTCGKCPEEPGIMIFYLSLNQYPLM